MRAKLHWSQLVCGLTAFAWIAVFLVGAYQSEATPPLFSVSVAQLERLGAIRLPVSAPSELWRIAVSWLIHVDVIHLLANLASLLCVAWNWPVRHRMLGPMVLGIVGSAAATISVQRDVATICVGGSGVLLALFPTVIAHAPSRRRVGVCLVVSALLFAGGFFPSGDWPSHIGGLLVGVLWLAVSRARA